MNWIELLGYAASVLVAVSLTMNSIARLRFLNLIGSSAFAAYGLLVGAYPVMAVNAFIAVVNVIFLARMQPGRSEAFELLALDHPDNRYLRRFLEFHAADIARFFPSFDPERLDRVSIVLILRDMLPVGVVLAERTADDTLTIHLDYVIPSHRDFRCADYFYKSWDSVLECEGVCFFKARGEVEEHRNYLRRIGFREKPEGGGDWFYRAA